MTVKRIHGTVVVECDCHKDQKMAIVSHGVLIIEAKHHGIMHISRTPLTRIADLCNPSNEEQLTSVR